MKRTDYMVALKSPLPNAVLKKWPKGNVMQYWGENPARYSASQASDLHRYLGGHMGVDIATFHRDPVHAAHDGIVVAAHGDRTSQGGLEVWITSPELDGELPGNSRIRTVYCHLDEFVVIIGQYVRQGDVIGYEGNTGFIVSGGTPYWGNAPAGKGTHLHFGLYEDKLVNGTWVPRYVNVLRNSTDPLPYISETPDNPTGNLSGFTVVLNNLAALLVKWRDRGITK